MYISLMTKDVKHFLKCLSAILDSSVESSLFRSVLHFVNWILCSLDDNFLSFLYIVDEVNYLISQIFLLLFSVYLLVYLWFFNLGFPCVSLYAPGTHFVDKTGLRLTEIHLPLPPSAGIKEDMH